MLLKLYFLLGNKPVLWRCGKNFLSLSLNTTILAIQLALYSQNDIVALTVEKNTTIFAPKNCNHMTKKFALSALVLFYSVERMSFLRVLMVFYFCRQQWSKIIFALKYEARTTSRFVETLEDCSVAYWLIIKLQCSVSSFVIEIFSNRFVKCARIL